ncbi:MAG TPA: L,D-transpeptidase family protein [Allosphingosinicella sp.]|nr:L,D-transpeptidase family protein [Allosphingosinicella sp.]
MGLLLGSAAPPERAEPPPPAPAEPPLTRTVFQAVLAPEPVAAPAPAPQAARRPAPTGAVRILVSLPQQRLWVFRGRELIATSPVSTGKRGHETPTGSFPILQKRIEHYSNIYDNAPMPYMQRLTHYGIALHGGRVPGYPASHGCIRLPHAFARRLYRLTDFNSRVIVTRARPRSTAHALSLAS